MPDERVEQLLRGYRPPQAPAAMDARVLARATRLFAWARVRSEAADLARDAADVFGFGYVNYLVDVVTATDAEYSVELV